MTSSEDAFERFWAFSLDRYSRPGVSEACLALQDTLRADVNVVLLCLWTAQVGQHLSATTLSALIDGMPGSWHRDVVVPMRAARKAMKGRTVGGDRSRVETVRDRVKAAEIACEKLEQQLLVEAIAGQLTRSDCAPVSRAATKDLARASLSAYVELIAPGALKSAGTDIETLIESCIA